MKWMIDKLFRREKHVFTTIVWIGMNCIILKGVRIGDNTIIAGGAVVTKNCEQNAIYAGNPAKLIRRIGQ